MNARVLYLAPWFFMKRGRCMQNRKYSLASAVWFCFRYAPWAAVLKLVIEVISGALTPLMVLVVASFINNAVAYVTADGNLAPLVIAIGLMAAYFAYSQASQIIVRLADKTLDNALKENLRPQLIQKQARTLFALLENPETLDLISRVCGNAEKQMAAIFNAGIKVLGLAIQVFGVMALLAAHIRWIIPLFLLSAVPIVLISRRGGHKIYDIFKESTKLTRLHYYLSDILVGREAAAERTLFGYADYVNRKFSAAHLKRSNMVTKALAIEETAINACGLILNVLVITALFALLPSVGDGTLSHGLYVSLVGALIGLARMITGVLSKLVRDTVEYTEYMREFTRFFALPESGIENGGSVRDEASTFTGLEIRNLRFRYTPDSPYVLDGINLKLEKGKSYSLIGRNGAGKSTLTKILLGLYRDFEGEILINGADIASYGTDDLRRLFSIVYQDFAKYYIPFSDNITLGNKNGDFDTALRLAELENTVSKLPQKENNVLGKIFDDGADISGGEWQKVAIARSLYANTPFMILDEPTASLSPMTESKLYKRFAEITKDKTSLLISHRLGSTKLSDVLFVLDDGVIAETGTHDELMGLNGIYAEMFKSQRSWYDGR
jgi:ATP-binding cassette subfamily B protein